MAGMTWEIGDWQRAQDYPPPTSNVGIFAWEFLRRSPEYRTHWESATDASPVFHPSYRGWEPGVHGFRARGGGTITERGPDEISIDMAIYLRFSNAVVPDHVTDGKQLPPAMPGELHVALDLDAPLDWQLHGIRTLYRVSQPKGAKVAKSPKFRPSLFPRYLRILDAKESGAKRAEIAKVLFPYSSASYDDGTPALKALDKEAKRAAAIRDADWLRLRYLKRRMVAKE